MLRRCLAACVILVIGGFALAETIRGVITEVKDDSIKVSVRKKGEEPTEKTLSIKGAKFYKTAGKGKDAEEIKLDDVKAAVERAGKGKGKLKGAFATIEADGDKASKVTIFAGKGKGKGKGKVKKDSN